MTTGPNRSSLYRFQRHNNEHVNGSVGIPRDQAKILAPYMKSNVFKTYLIPLNAV